MYGCIKYISKMQPEKNDEAVKKAKGSLMLINTEALKIPRDSMRK
jgi:hypothetical protein